MMDTMMTVSQLIVNYVQKNGPNIVLFVMLTLVMNVLKTEMLQDVIVPVDMLKLMESVKNVTTIV